MSERTLYFGGSFNPVGIHHLQMATYAIERGGYDKCVFIPCVDQPLKPKNSLVPYHNRLEMLMEAIEGDKRFTISDVDASVQAKGQEPYTINTVRELKKRGATEVHMLIGMDSLLHIQEWHDPVALERECIFQVTPRGGSSFQSADAWENMFAPNVKRLAIPLVAGSSTEIRRRLKEKLPINYFVPDCVRYYINFHGLYR